MCNTCRSDFDAQPEKLDKLEQPEENGHKKKKKKKDKKKDTDPIEDEVPLPDDNDHCKNDVRPVETTEKSEDEHASKKKKKKHDKLVNFEFCALPHCLFLIPILTTLFKLKV